MAEVDLVALVLGVFLRLAEIHLRAARGLEHTRGVEGERALELAVRGRGSDGLFLSGGRVHGVVPVLVDLEAVQVAYLAGVTVDVVLLAEVLAHKEQVVHVVGAEHQPAVLGGHLQLVQRPLHLHKVVRGKALAPGFPVRVAGSFQYRGLRRVLGGAQRMGGLGELRVVDGVAVALFYTRHLVVADGVQLVIGDRGHFRLELVKGDGDVLVLKRLHGYRVGRVVDKHVRVHAHLHQVDDVIVDDARLVGHAVQPGTGKPAAQDFH